eukprot:TRINITY_DN11503_c0_g1_i1.p1 TRINITY_DN11503_c0_g1~~TRINITY_DN11503_c0_g1_i1.p1  ORF type:complete len:135 (+),score=14.54 TRINITY_DN11503_c0_g1_i1:45-407(+)
MLCTLAIDLPEMFIPHVEETLKVMEPLLTFWYDGEVRICAISSIPHLVKCAVLGVSKQEIRPEWTSQMFAHLIKSIRNCFRLEINLSILGILKTALKQTLLVSRELSLQYFAAQNGKGTM